MIGIIINVRDWHTEYCVMMLSLILATISFELKLMASLRMNRDI